MFQVVVGGILIVAILVRGRVVKQGTIDELTRAQQRYDIELAESDPTALAVLRPRVLEAIRKTMTMLQGVLQRAVEWGRVPTNAVKITRKPLKPHRPAVAGDPANFKITTDEDLTRARAVLAGARTPAGGSTP